VHRLRHLFIYRNEQSFFFSKKLIYIPFPGVVLAGGLGLVFGVAIRKKNIE
jgi:hypothetical protein